jgi:hypothetical protein
LKDIGLKWKERVKYVAVLNFIPKVYFGPPSFSGYRWAILLVVRNSILVSNFIFLFFQSFFFRRVRGLLDFGVERECSHWRWFQPYKWFKSVSIGFISWGYFHPGVFFFCLLLAQWGKYDRENIFEFEFILIFLAIFRFLRPLISLSRFVGCLGQNRLKMSF